MPVTTKPRRSAASSDSEFTRFLYRCAAELLFRSSRVHAYVVELARSVSGDDYLELTSFLRQRLRESQLATQMLIGTALRGPAASLNTDLFVAIGSMSEVFEEENERLAQLPPLHAKPEMFAIDAAFDRRPRRKPARQTPRAHDYSILLGGVFNAFEFEFDRGLTEPKTVLELGMCDFASPSAWPILAHEIGHARHNETSPRVSSWAVNRTLTRPVEEWPIAHQVVEHWAEEIYCDFVAATVLGPAPMLALLSMEQCTFGNRHTDFVVEKDGDKLRWAHPPTHWRATAVAEFLRHFGSDVYLRPAANRFERFAFERLRLQHLDRERVREQDRDRLLFTRFFLPVVTAVESHFLRGDDLPRHAIDGISLARCEDRLKHGYPVGAQGIERGILNRELDQYFTDDARRGVPRAFYELASRFDEQPVNLATILLAAHRRREAIFSEYETDGSRLTHDADVDAMNDRLTTLERMTELSIRTAGVHQYWLAQGDPKPTRAELEVLPKQPLAIHARDNDRDPPRTGEERYLLSDFQILRRLIADTDDAFFVSPLLDCVTQVGPSSIDVRLGTVLKVTRVSNSTALDLSGSVEELERELDEYLRIHQIAPDESFVIHPGQFALATTLEFLRFPADLAGRLEGRSTLARLGLQVHATAGFIDPGYAGTLTFELSNAGNLPIRIPPGYRLGQICLFRVDHVQVPYDRKIRRKYGDDPTGERPQVRKERELARRSTSRSGRGVRE